MTESPNRPADASRSTEHGITVEVVHLPAGNPLRARCLCGWVSAIAGSRPTAAALGADHVAAACPPWCVVESHEDPTRHPHDGYWHYSSDLVDGVRLSQWYDPPGFVTLASTVRVEVAGTYGLSLDDATDLADAILAACDLGAAVPQLT